MVGDKKETWCRSLPSFITHPIVFLSVSSIHPTPEPSLTITPSLRIPLPPNPSFHHKLNSPTRGTRSAKANDKLFWPSFTMFSLVVPIYHWIQTNFLHQKPTNLLCLLLPYLLRIKKYVFELFHLCHCYKNITANISHQPQLRFFWLNTLSHLHAIHLGFRP